MITRERLYLCAAILLLPFMITGDSLWIDEGTAAKFAWQPDFHQWVNALVHEGGSDSQMLLGDFCAWVGGRLIGQSEWQLRAVNLFWGALTLLIAARIGRRLQIPWLPLLFALQPFFWYYTNEARPYGPQFTFGTLILLSLVQFIQDRGQGLLWSVTFMAGSALLCLATMLAPAQIAVTAAVAGVIAVRNRWSIDRRTPVVILAGLLLMLPIGYYYLTTVIRGAKGVQLWNVDFRYLVFIPYEISGAIGLGPSLDHIRDFALKGSGQLIMQMVVHGWMSFILLAVVIGVIISGVWNRKRDDNPYFLPILIPFLFEVIVLFIVGILIHKAFWPRHYSAAFPCYVTALALALRPLLVSQRKLARLVPVFLLFLLVAALLGIHLGSEHKKEDYRWAAQAALQAQQEGKNVWWCGGGSAAMYYGIQFDSSAPRASGIHMLTNRQWDGKFPLVIEGIESGIPDEVIISRPDVHDANGAVRDFVCEKGYRLEASRGSFDIWVR